jgi:hypothetical protein
LGGLTPPGFSSTRYITVTAVLRASKATSMRRRQGMGLNGSTL